MTFQELHTKEYLKYKITTLTFHNDITAERVYCGVDPGTRKMGVSVYVGKTIFVNQINFTSPEKEAIKKMLSIAEAMMFCGIPHHLSIPGISVTEGASYGESFGQVNLAEARATSMLVLAQIGFEVKKLSPLSIRKISTGNSKNKGECFDFGPDAASSFLCLLAAMTL